MWLTLPGVKLTITETEEISDSVVREITYAIGHIANDLIENIAIRDDSNTHNTKRLDCFSETVDLADNLTWTASQVYHIGYLQSIRTEKILVRNSRRITHLQNSKDQEQISIRHNHNN